MEGQRLEEANKRGRFKMASCHTSQFVLGFPRTEEKLVSKTAGLQRRSDFLMSRKYINLPHAMKDYLSSPWLRNNKKQVTMATARLQSFEPEESSGRPRHTPLIVCGQISGLCLSDFPTLNCILMFKCNSINGGVCWVLLLKLQSDEAGKTTKRA